MTTAIMFYCNRPFHDFCQLLTAAEFYRRLYGGGGGAGGGGGGWQVRAFPHRTNLCKITRPCGAIS